MNPFPHACLRPRKSRGSTSMLMTALIFLLGGASPVRALDVFDTWHPRTSPAPSSDYIQSVVFGNGRFVAICKQGGRVLTSPDGTTWSLHESGSKKNMYGLAHGNGRFVAVGAGGIAFVSPDGEAWTPSETETSVNFNSVAFVNGLFVAAAASGHLLTSPDGDGWDIHVTASSNYWENVACANGTYVAVGWDWSTGHALAGITTNFEDWEIQPTGATRYLDRILHVAGQLVAVGYAGGFQTSPDGREWTEVKNASARWLHDMVHANGSFVAVGESGALTTSQNAIEWTPRASGTKQTLWGIAFGNDTFVAVGENNTILQTDAVTPMDAPVVITQPSMEAGGFQFQFNSAAGTTYEILSSSNLVDWTSLGTVLAEGSTTAYIDAGLGGGVRMYRVVQP